MKSWTDSGVPFAHIEVIRDDQMARPEDFRRILGSKLVLNDGTDRQSIRSLPVRGCSKLGSAGALAHALGAIRREVRCGAALRADVQRRLFAQPRR